MNIFSNTKKAKSVLADLERENPSFRLWKSISAQLDFILDDFEASGEPKKIADKERVKSLILGLSYKRN